MSASMNSPIDLGRSESKMFGLYSRLGSESNTLVLNIPRQHNSHLTNVRDSLIQKLRASILSDRRVVLRDAPVTGLTCVECDHSMGYPFFNAIFSFDYVHPETFYKLFPKCTHLGSVN